MKKSTFLVVLGIVSVLTISALYTPGNTFSDTMLLLLGYRGEEPILAPSTVLIGLCIVDVLFVGGLMMYRWKLRRQVQVPVRNAHLILRRLAEQKRLSGKM